MSFSENATVFPHHAPRQEIDAARARGEVVVVLPAPAPTTPMSVPVVLDEYEVVNLREGLLFLRAVGGDTGDWLGQILNRLPEVAHTPPNKTEQEQRRELAVRIGWRALWPL